MESNIHLIIHNIICIISAIATIGMAFFTYLNGTRKTENVAFTLMLISVAVFVISHVIGVNIADPVLSKNVLMFNVSILFIAAFNVHAIIALIGKVKEKKSVIIMFYVGAVALSIFFIIFPDFFLLNSEQKMYFPNYYEPGALNWVRMAFLYFTGITYMSYLLVTAIMHEKNAGVRSQYKYMLLTILLGYGFGYIPNFLVYDITIDPLYGMSFAFIFMIPFVYGAVRYGLFNVKVIAKQAFAYSFAVVIVGGCITLFNYSDQLIQRIFPAFPLWITPLISSGLAVTIGAIVWRSLKESDILEYEFITTVTHKFRTPLTHIKWASENLIHSTLSPVNRTRVEHIQTSTTKLVELTNILVKVSETGTPNEEYTLMRNNLSDIVASVADSLTSEFFAKHIKVTRDLRPETYGLFDEPRLRFVIETLLENAFNYTPDGGTCTISTRSSKGSVIFSVQDSGIGIPATEIPLLFSKFYRGKKASTTDTEGMGIGLFISKEIIGRHHGTIWAESAGPGTGTTFSFSIPEATH